MLTRLLLVFFVTLFVKPDATAAPAPPRRIISLAPGTTEILFALGLGKSVVGDTVYCDYPPAARAIAKIGDINVNYEKVVALHPDLIVASDANHTAALHLRQLHLPVYMISPTSYLATELSIRALGQVTGTSAAARRIIAHMEAVRKAAVRRSAQSQSHPLILPVLGLNPLYVAGSGTFIGDLISLAGGRSSAAAISGYAPYSLEQVLAHPPDYILAGPSLQSALHADPILSRLPAVGARRYIAIDSDILSRPGPRLADALLQLSHALHPGAK